MCHGCVRTKLPERGTMCLESGAYFINYAGCKECDSMQLGIIDKEVEEDDESETVNYTHICKDCKHVVAKHEYTFEVEDEFQKFSMNCMLCGWAEDERSYMPDDPRQTAEADYSAPAAAASMGAIAADRAEAAAASAAADGDDDDDDASASAAAAAAAGAASSAADPFAVTRSSGC